MKLVEKLDRCLPASDMKLVDWSEIINIDFIRSLAKRGYSRADRIEQASMRVVLCNTLMILHCRSPIGLQSDQLQHDCGRERWANILTASNVRYGHQKRT